ncbi:uncharacterized protein LOC110226497 [Arabidopsis lyrata subsp. lyrata]|uniref:uncharacterized protein LOC110226497 n=1 Tax=Arabidopsis lyrata subsp. lyrata TaxID=81972 RepID=UPI000A29CB41|nr:uncharacterized protein LOC110226497 [Arabidopsis lyrata subsp. lyrata]|eukprot:XP_020874084.1 uncharacterized protein LOC110226497 [Arabidopsis lyrata subsp. lyrata]
MRKPSKPDILFFVETKNGFSYVNTLAADLGYPHSYIIPSDGLSGGMAIFWNDNIDIEFLDPPTLNYTDMYVSTSGHPTFCLTYVYSDPDQRHRNAMWERMKVWAETGMYRNKPRLVLGDFNDIKSNGEKLGGPLRSEASFKTFRKMLNSSGLHDLKTLGARFTWYGQRHTHTIQSRIDRAVASVEWFDAFPRAYVKLLDWIGSDHRPLLVDMGDKKKQGCALFRYDNRWRFSKELKEELEKTWLANCQDLPGDQFHEALRRCRVCMSHWKSHNIHNSTKRIQALKQRIHQVYNSSPIDFNLIKALKSELTFEYRMEEEYWRTKSRIQCLIAGDRNTRFFHEKTKQRRGYNRITSIIDSQGKVWSSEEDLHRVIIDYFDSLFFSDCQEDMDMILQHIQPSVTQEMNEDLVRPISEEELYRAVHQMAREKAPGPDGLNPGFYQDHWPTIRLAVMKRMGFSEIWCKWIMKCITTVTYSVLVNGQPVGNIIPHRGIHQSDPISPYLYLLRTEGLSALIHKSIKSGTLHGFKASRTGPAISHLLFADDSLLFCKATVEECSSLLNILHQYEKVSGKEVLLKSIITAIPAYSMSCFLLPMRIIKQIERAMRGFWWSSSKDKHKIPWVAWRKITNPKNVGGLAIRDLKDFNVALLAKQSWRLLQQPFSLMARVFKAKYYPKQNLFEAKVKSQSSYAWKSISQGTQLLSYGLKYLVGNGTTINVWRDPWLPLNPHRPARGPGQYMYPHMKVADLLQHGANDIINWIYTKDGLCSQVRVPAPS